jgi:FkbM family methyltransferase
VVISGGAGEDISFEVELQNKIGLTTYIIDPTPDAIQHFNTVSKRGTKNREFEYSDSSRQDPNSYDTSALDFTRLNYFQEALWNRATNIKLYEPRNGTRDSSHSISGIHNNYRRNTRHILVRATTIPQLLLRIGLLQIDLLKLDIEGAALEVLELSFTKGIFPKQIILEVDELHFPGPKSWIRARRLFKLLNHYEYDCVNRDNCDFTFIRI